MSSKRPKRTARDEILSNNPVFVERRLYVGNLRADQTSRLDLENLFSKYGEITAICIFGGYAFVQFNRKEDADAAAKGENGRGFKGRKLEINKAMFRSDMNKDASKFSPSRRDFNAYGEGQESRRDHSRSPLRGSREPRERDSRAVRDARDGREPRDLRNSGDQDMRDLRDEREREFLDARDLRDSCDTRDIRDSREYRDLRETRDARDLRVRDTRETRDVRDPLFERYREARDPRDPLYRVGDVSDKFRLDDLYRKKDDLFDPFRDPLNRLPEDRLKREEGRREELYRQYFDELQRKFDAERAVDCSVVVVNKQTKEYAESVGRKVRDLGLMVDLIFLNTEVSLTQALEDVARGGTPFAIVVTQQHVTHLSCTLNILFGSPQEHRNMPLADAMLLVARMFERYKVDSREKEREDITRQAAKLSAEAILRERGPLDEGVRGGHPPGIMNVIGLLADNRYVTAEETDKVILYLQQRKERLLGISSDSLTSQLSRQTGTAPANSLDAHSSLAGSQPLQLSQQLGPSATQTLSNSQQELQAKILSLFNSGASTSNPVNSAASASASQNYGNMSNTLQRSAASMQPGILGPVPQRPQPTAIQLPNILGAGTAIKSVAPRPGPSQMQSLYGQLQNLVQAPGIVAGQRPGASGINFDNPGVQKALDTLIQTGPSLSNFVGQAAAQALRGGPPQQSAMAYPRHF